MDRGAAVVAAGKGRGVPEEALWPAILRVVSGQDIAPDGFLDDARLDEVLAELQRRTRIIVEARPEVRTPASVTPGVSGVAGAARDPGGAGALQPEPAAIVSASHAAAGRQGSRHDAATAAMSRGALSLDDNLEFPPLKTWLKRAIEDACRPSGDRESVGTWRPPPFQLRFFEFRRWAKGHPDLAGLDASLSWDVVRSAVPSLLRSLGIEARTNSEFNGEGLRDEEEAHELWAGGWDEIASPRGWDRITTSLRYALAAPLHVRSVIPRAGRTLTLLVGAAAWLQASRGLLPICLPRDTWARNLNVSRPRISALVLRMVEADLLRPVDPAAIPQRGHALDYRFDCERFPLTVRHLGVRERAEMSAAFQALPRRTVTPRAVETERARLPKLGSIGGTASSGTIIPLRRREE